MTWIAGLTIATAWPSAGHTAELTIPRAVHPPTLESIAGNPLDAPGRVEGFTQREPGDGVSVSQHTVAYLSYDQDRLYVIFVCEEQDPAGVRARLAPRESIAADDQVGVLLDTFHDHRRAYLFASNPLGIQTDALLTEGQPDDYSYDTVWYSEGRLTDRGYVVWMAIPFKSLRLPPTREQHWGIALVRNIPRNSEQSYWPAITKRIDGLAPQFATVTGLSGISPGRNLQLIPYATTAVAQVRDQSSRLRDAHDVRTGLDAKAVIRDALTVDVAIHPDFSQVESDQPQVTTNQRFEVFFPEKRPFFIENAGYFLYGAVPAGGRVPETLFFSRRIVDPEVGVRVTGKVNKWAVGGLAIGDSPPSSTRTERPAVSVGVVHVQRELGAQSAVGLLTSARAVGTHENRLAALDGRFRRQNWVVTALLVASETKDGVQRRSGPAYNVNVNHTNRRILYNVFYSDRAPSFRADLGFVPRVDIRQIEQYIEYRWRPRSGPIVAVGPNSYFRLNWDRRGRLQEWIVRYPFQMDLKGRTSVFLRRVESGELFRGFRFREHLQTVNVQTEWLKWLAVTESLEGGRSVNYFPPAGIAPTLARFLTASVSLSFRPAPQFRADATYLLNRLRDIPAHPDEPASSIFDNHVARSTFTYQFSRRLSARTIIDYRGVLSNPALVALPRTKTLTGDVLFTYLVQPGTALYVGYTSGFDNLNRLDGERNGPPTIPQSRQLFIKTSYWLRF